MSHFSQRSISKALKILSNHELVAVALERKEEKALYIMWIDTNLTFDWIGL